MYLQHMVAYFVMLYVGSWTGECVFILISTLQQLRTHVCSNITLLLTNNYVRIHKQNNVTSSISVIK